MVVIVPWHNNNHFIQLRGAWQFQGVYFMTLYESLAHSKRDCTYHIVFIPKGRKKNLYGQVRKYLGRGSLKNRESSNFIRSKDRKKIFLW